MKRHEICGWGIAVLLVYILMLLGAAARAGVEEQIVLGRFLFFDPRLSADGTISCSSCHNPDRGWTDGLKVAVGNRGRLGTRNTPPITNAAFQVNQFWDMRTDNLVEQTMQPLENAAEMGLFPNGGVQSRQQACNRMQRIPGYARLAVMAFGAGATINPITASKAIEMFERTVVEPDDCPATLFFAGDRSALSEPAARGAMFFAGRGNCIQCHIPPHYRDGTFHNTGVAFRFQTGDQGRSGILAPNQRTNDTFRAFKTPSLLEILRTPPYFHDGSAPNLETVFEHYSTGAVNRDNLRDRRLDPRIVRLNMTDQEKRDLKAFFEEGFLSKSYPKISAPTRFPQ